MKKIVMLFAIAMFAVLSSVPTMFAAEDVALNELITKAEFDASSGPGYKAARDEGHRLLSDGRADEATDSFLEAASLSPFKIVRARHLANAALSQLIAGESDLGELGSENVDQASAEKHLRRALSLLERAEKMSDGCESGHHVAIDELTKNISQIRGAIGMRLDRFVKK